MLVSDKIADTVAVIRSFNNPHVTKQVKNLLNMGVGRVIVVINATPDRGSTKGFLKKYLTDPRVHIIEMFDGYSWSSALNIALMSIQMTDVKRIRDGMDPFEFVFNVSVETQFTRNHLESMILAANTHSHVGVVGTSFTGKQNSNRVDLGSSYRHPRNTGMLIRLQALGTPFGGFDLWCDNAGGMEDIDFVLRMLALSNLTYTMLDLRVPLILGQHYDQATKEEREQAAMQQIIARWRNLFPCGSLERIRIDGAIHKMKLED